MTIIQEHTKVNYDYRNQNGAGVWLPPNVQQGMNNLKRIDPYTESVSQLYPIGAIGTLDQRKFAYCYMSAALAGWSRLVIDTNYVPFVGNGDADGFEGNVYLAHAAGVSAVSIEDATVRAENYYMGGYLTLFHADGVYSTTIRIAASSSGAGAAHTGPTLYLDNPTPWALANHDYCGAYRCPYSSITDSQNTGYEAFMGVSLIPVTSTYYSWIQIGGPVWLAQHAEADCPGYDVHHREAYAWLDGTCVESQGDATLQRIGYALGEHATTKGDTFIMLQLGT